MTQIEFPEQTAVFAKDQPEYLPLPAFVNPDPNSMGEVISLWQLSPAELEEINRNGGKIYFTICTFHGHRSVSVEELQQSIDKANSEGVSVINTGGLPPMRPDVFSPFESNPNRE